MFLSLDRLRRPAVSEGVHGEALVDGETAAFESRPRRGRRRRRFRRPCRTRGSRRQRGTLVADGDGLLLLGVDGAPGGLAVHSALSASEATARRAVKSAFVFDQLAAGLERRHCRSSRERAFRASCRLRLPPLGFGLERVAFVVRQGGVRDVAHDDGGGGFRSFVSSRPLIVNCRRS